MNNTLHAWKEKLLHRIHESPSFRVRLGVGLFCVCFFYASFVFQLASSSSSYDSSFWSLTSLDAYGQDQPERAFPVLRLCPAFSAINQSGTIIPSPGSFQSHPACFLYRDQFIQASLLPLPVHTGVAQAIESFTAECVDIDLSTIPLPLYGDRFIGCSVAVANATPGVLSCIREPNQECDSRMSAWANADAQSLTLFGVIRREYSGIRSSSDIIQYRMSSAHKLTSSPNPTGTSALDKSIASFTFRWDSLAIELYSERVLYPFAVAMGVIGGQAVLFVALYFIVVKLSMCVIEEEGRKHTKLPETPYDEQNEYSPIDSHGQDQPLQSNNAVQYMEMEGQ